jgi:hypothetical protein
MARSHASDHQLEQVVAEPIRRVLFLPIIGSVLYLDTGIRRCLRPRNPNGQYRPNDRDGRHDRARGGGLVLYLVSSAVKCPS